jgi:choline dehydrogenase-like flavoprotein
MRDGYSLICVGTSFASAFFLHRYLKTAGPDARVLVLERGQRLSQAEFLKAGWKLRDEGDRTFHNATKSKPWMYAPTFGGTSNLWFGNTPRMHPEDFECATKYGVASDWPLSYADLEPYYTEAERLMNVSGSDRTGPFQRSAPFPLPPHELSEPERWMEAAQPEHFFPCPTARASRPVPGQRSACCTSFRCNVCPVGAKFTVPNGLGELFADPRVRLEVGATVQRVVLEGGRVTGVEFARDGKPEEGKAELVALGANAIFNPFILLNSGIEHAALGRYLHEQVGWSMKVYLERGNAFGGSTSCTGHNYRLMYGEHRRERSAVLLETHSKPLLRIEPGRWRQLIRVTGVFEDIPHELSQVTVEPGEGSDEARPRVSFHGVSEYAKRGLDAFERDLGELLEGLPVERVESSVKRKTEGHIMGTARMGSDPTASVVDGDQVHHTYRNLLVLGGSSFPTGPVANPSLTIAALSLRSADRLLNPSRERARPATTGSAIP